MKYVTNKVHYRFETTSNAIPIISAKIWAWRTYSARIFPECRAQALTYFFVLLLQCGTRGSSRYHPWSQTGHREGSSSNKGGESYWLYIENTLYLSDTIYVSSFLHHLPRQCFLMYHISHENSHGIDVTCFAVVAFTYMLQACFTSTETIWRLSNPRNNFHTDGLVQEKRNSSALGIELRLFGTNPLIYWRCRRCVVFCIYIRIYCLNKKMKDNVFLAI